MFCDFNYFRLNLEDLDMEFCWLFCFFIVMFGIVGSRIKFLSVFVIFFLFVIEKDGKFFWIIVLKVIFYLVYFKFVYFLRVNKLGFSMWIVFEVIYFFLFLVKRVLFSNILWYILWFIVLVWDGYFKFFLINVLLVVLLFC